MDKQKKIDLMNRANSVGFTIVAEGGRREYPGKIAGYELKFPYVTNNQNGISAEVTWALVRRIANGETKKVFI